jgi:hypothetical protein
MTLRNKIVGAIVIAYLGSGLAGAITSSNLTSNFNYSQERANGQIVQLEAKREKEQFVPEKLTITQGESYVIGKDSDKNGTLDEIILSSKSEDAQRHLTPLATQENLTKIYNSIIESEEYRETISKRQRLGNLLFGYVMLLGVIGMFGSDIYKYSTATEEQLSHPFFHCR